ALCAGWLRACNGELTDVNNGSGHYRPSAKDLAKMITIIGHTGDISNLRVASVISENLDYYYFPAMEVKANSPASVKTSWGHVNQKVILTHEQYKQIYMANVAEPVPFAQIMNDYREQTAELERSIPIFPFDKA